MDIYIDFKSPAAFLAFKPTKAFLTARGQMTPGLKAPGLKAQWHPFRVVTRQVPHQGTSESVAESHKRVRAESRRRIFLKYAEVQNVTMRFPNHRIGTDLALGALAEIEGDRLPYIAACFAAYWTDNADLDDAGIVQDLLRQSGAVHSGDLSTARASLEAALDKAEEAGVVDTPGYIVQGQMFVGREHLPWIGEILDN